MIKEVLDVMIDLAKEGMTMIVVTHEMDLPRAWLTGCFLWTSERSWRETPLQNFRSPTARTDQTISEPDLH